MSIDTIPALFLNSVEEYNSAQAFRYKKGGRWVDVSHQEAFQKAYNAAEINRNFEGGRVDRGYLAPACAATATGPRSRHHRGSETRP